MFLVTVTKFSAVRTTAKLSYHPLNLNFNSVKLSTIVDQKSKITLRYMIA